MVIHKSTYKVTELSDGVTESYNGTNMLLCAAHKNSGQKVRKKNKLAKKIAKENFRFVARHSLKASALNAVCVKKK